MMSIRGLVGWGSRNTALGSPERFWGNELEGVDEAQLMCAGQGSYKTSDQYYSESRRTYMRHDRFSVT
jgi:hypothetical protein